jgi:hypothetical protein
MIGQRYSWRASWETATETGREQKLIMAKNNNVLVSAEPFDASNGEGGLAAPGGLGHCRRHERR